MKIWFQSGTEVGAGERLNPYLKSMVNHAQRVSRPDAVCEFHGQDKSYPVNRSLAARNLVVRGYIRNAMLAEAQGFDAIMTNTLDLGLNEVREVVKIPVVGLAQSTLSFSCQIAPNFAFIAYHKAVYPGLVDLAVRYGFKDRMIDGGCMAGNFSRIPSLWTNPESYREEFLKIAKSVVSRGATLIFPVGLYLSQWLIDQNIRDVDGAVIVDVLAIGIKTAELMVDLKRLGVDRPKIGSYAPVPEDVRAILAKEFGVG